jgi:bifunctional DNase/RNase
MRSAVWLLLFLSATLAAAAPIEVTIEGVRLDADTATPVVRLVERIPSGKGAPRELPIWIGPFEAQAIVLEMRGASPTRPLTHDLMKSLLERLGAKLDRVVIDELRDDTYFAKLHLRAPDGRDVVVDARPSDAIALALRLQGQVFVSEELFAKAPVGKVDPAAGHLWGLTLQDLTPEIAAFFEVPVSSGVLVSDVEQKAPAQEAARGDVITALDGVPVASVAELTTRAGTREAAAPVRLSVRRAGRQIVLTFPAATDR